MKKILEKIFIFVKIIAVIVLAMFCITETDAVQGAVYESIMRCLNIIIPSLYGMMIISVLLYKCGIFSMFSGIFPIFLVSQFAGYPVGAKLLCSEYEEGKLSLSEAEKYSGVCFGAGPAFIFGCISSQLYGNRNSGVILLLSAITSNLILFLVVKIFTNKKACPREKIKIRISSQLVTESILSSGRAMADICIMIAAFSIISSGIECTGLIGNVEDSKVYGIFYALLDVTNVSGLSHGDYSILPIISGLLSFGGICVLMQINAVTKGKIRLLPMILFRSTAAILSGIICRIIMPFMLHAETVSVGSFYLHEAASPVPSIMLILMTIFLFVEINEENKKMGN